MKWIINTEYVQKPRTISISFRGFGTVPEAHAPTEKDRLLDFLSSESLAPARELCDIGVSGTAISCAAIT